jgi:subtilisin family serine protease
MVMRVEPSRIRKWQGIPSDTLASNQWALPKIAWDQVYGNVTPQTLTSVAILDTGIDGAHPDLIGAIAPGTSIIDDSNGLTDPNGHGTWLAGIVAARTNNGEGIAGVGFSQVQVMPVKVLDADGLGQDADVISGIVWAADNGASVILMAFSNPGFSESLQEAIDYAWSRNVVLVAAAGNDGSNTPTFPAGDRGVIGVSATDSNDNLAASSNYGATVFLAAPGVDILGTYKGNTYVTWTGTSGSAAIVAGSAALMRAVDPTLSNGVIVSRLARTADPAGTQEQTGNGRVQLARALADTNTESIQPAGAPPVGTGGPFVGPYKAAVGAFSYASATSSVTLNSGASTSFSI